MKTQLSDAESMEETALAKKIALAINCHDDLLAACKAAEIHYAMICEVICLDNPPPGGIAILNKLRAVIAKAEAS